MGNLFQLKQISEYYSEYLKNINSYSDITRHSLFCLYLNINKNGSIVEDNTKSNYSKHYHGIVYDSYEYTPIYAVNQITNQSEDVPNQHGLMFSGLSSVTTYSIKQPNIGDILSFPYENNKLDEIYRVKSIQVNIGNANNDKNTYHQLELEYASIKANNLKDIKVLNQYCYLLSESKYITRQQYVLLFNNISKTTDYIQNLKFNNNLELYDNVSDMINAMIYLFLQKYRNYISFQIKLPYGISGKIDYLLTGDSIFEII